MGKKLEDEVQSMLEKEKKKKKVIIKRKKRKENKKGEMRKEKLDRFHALFSLT